MAVAVALAVIAGTLATAALIDRPAGPAPGRSSEAVEAVEIVGAPAQAATPAPAFAAVAAPTTPPPTVEITGRGWGHGRGMGQYGALGYARDHGWTAAQILDHYYGGTTSGPAPAPGVVDPARVRVELRSMTGRPAALGLASGQIRLATGTGEVLRTVTGAVRLTVVGGETAIAVAPDCGGPWTEAGRVGHTLVVATAVPTAGSNGGPDGLLHVCGPTSRTWYEGAIWSTTAGGRQRTMNLVTVEQYLRGVVPNEVPALWPSPVLEAQAVAARSYALAGDSRRVPWADTCDDTTCQRYLGRYVAAGTNPTPSTHARTDAAVGATAGIVRLTGDGRVARTEFSSSSGGHTAGGTFPAVVDAGDAVTANRYHRWTAVVDLSGIEDRYDRGHIRAAVVTARNGLGPDGGRARTVEYRFERGTITVSADTARLQLGLRSDWFTFGSIRRGGDAVDETELAHRFVTDLYRTALGREPDDPGRRYWEGVVAAGLKYEHLGTLFFGSPEYVRRSGGTDERFVAALYRDLLGRSPDAAGRRYWLTQLAERRAGPADVANAFYRSVESRRRRVRALYRLLELAPPTASTVETDAARLEQIDDLRLAVELAGRSP